MLVHSSQPQDSPPSALIVGGSLSGLLVALALSRVGITSTLLERAGIHRPSGAALAADASHLTRVIGPDKARHVLERLGAPDRAGSLGSIPAAWQDLHTALLDLAHDEPLVAVAHDTRVDTVGQDAAGVWAVTATGATVRADVLVGADGYRSVVRRSQFPDQAGATFAGYVLWRGVVQETDVVTRSWPGTDMLDANGYIMFGYPLPGEDGSTRQGERRLGWAWYDATRNDLMRRTGAIRDGVVHHSLTANHIPEAAIKDLLDTCRRTWPAPWPRIIEATVATGGIICTPVAEHVPREMARGRAVLVGDAAHVATPMTGAGFGAALADAGELASQLTDAQPFQVPHALARYEEARIDDARRIVVSGQRFSRSFARNAA